MDMPLPDRAIDEWRRLAFQPGESVSISCFVCSCLPIRWRPRAVSKLSAGNRHFLFRLPHIGWPAAELQCSGHIEPLFDIIRRRGYLLSLMFAPVPESLRTRDNANVLSWLADKSAHDEVASALLGATRALGDVVTFCPDPKQFRYVVTATRGIIFGVATGMSAVSFRLDREIRQRALLSGGEAAPEIEADWVSFTLFRSDWPAHDLAFWALKAYVLARGNF